MPPAIATATYSRPWLAPYQLDALFSADRYAIVEASTKAGKTVGCIVWLTEQAMRGRKGWNYWWVAPTYAQAKIAFRRLKAALPRDIYTSHDGDLTLTLLTGAMLWFKTAEKPDGLFGDDVHAAVIDEASRCKEESWHAVRSTLTATNGPIRIIGNVKGRRNWAYALARKAESGCAGMAYAKITAHDAVQAGIITDAEVADAKAVLPDAVFRELYLAEPSDDAGNPFGLAAIRQAIRPRSTRRATCYGLDLAKSGDYCVLVGLDDLGHVCTFERWQGPWETTISRVLGMVTAGVTVLVDSTGAGDPVLEALQRQGRAKGLTFHGYAFSSPSKQKLMEGLAVAIQQQTVGYPDGVIVQELEVFEFEYRRVGVYYSAPEGLHDDCVCALALAVHQRTVGDKGPIVATVGASKDRRWQQQFYR